MNAHVTAAYKLDLPPTDTAVLVYLAHLADEKGQCYPGFGAIAKATGLDRSTVIRVLDRLTARENGRPRYITRTSRLRQTNLYCLKLPGLTAPLVAGRHHPAPEPAPSKVPQPTGGARPLGAQRDPPGGTVRPPLVAQCDPTSKGPGKDQGPPPTPPASPENGVVEIADAGLALMGATPGFAAFWSAYPEHRRRKSAQCFRFWEGNGLERLTLEIVAAVAAWKEHSDWKREGGRYIPGAFAFLDDAMWENAPAPLPQQQKPNVATVNARVPRD